MFLVYKKLMAIGVGVLDKNSLAPLKRADVCNMMNDKGAKVYFNLLKVDSKFTATKLGGDKIVAA